ncbi:ankyrin repeat domain-containing protein [Pseudomonas chlororaphis]|uniref:ankyrin repeat domain-containing protein n=1 Tax=Pseudomonas chlororaphis TaxID=587753 RepID=UPI00026E44D2|nr:ankyrin repeat domain-containing protein [Pseudomonas chlororaphis]EJK99837.1 hypothetical protein Pchl3084_4376 [Pseudomonas chlororaphis subsp. aureofaciens 30-84]
MREISLEAAYEVASIAFISLEFDRVVVPGRFSISRVFNIHFSRLPEYKGMFISVWPLLESRAEAGDWLLQQGADPERPNNKGTTPLMYAKDAYLAGRCRKTFQLLLRKGARLEAADHCGRALADYVTDEQFAQLRGAF